jgi:beta-glucosidase
MRRAEALLRPMTLEEKAMQRSAVVPFTLLGPDGPIRSMPDAQLKHGIGHVSGLGLFGFKPPETVAKTINAIQRYLVTRTRLGIPAIFHNGAANGMVSAQFTHFPAPIGLAATWEFTVAGPRRAIRRGERAFLSVATVG